jgi:hypothetical protein
MTSPKSDSSSTYESPFAKLARISPRRRQLWVVAYVNQTGGSPLVDEAFRDVEASFEGGADAVVLINEWSSQSELETTLSAVRARYPRTSLGVNYLGDDAEPYGYRDSFRLARDYGLQLVWTDFAGVDLINEKPPVSLHDIETARHLPAFYCSGVHMKYSTLKDPGKTIEQSALQAVGWVDGVIVTGLKTGMASDPEKVRRARQAIGRYPLGVASGVSPENVGSILENIDFALVASSLQDENKRIVRDQVARLRQAMGTENR